MAKKGSSKKSASTQSDGFSLITDFDVYLFKTGKHYKLYEKLGAHFIDNGTHRGTYFAVWAPNAKAVSVIGNFNQWKDSKHKLFPRWDESGIWEALLTDVEHGEAYKYAIHSNTGEYLEKADPFGSFYETPPRTASIVWEPHYEWKDSTWMNDRKKKAGTKRPYSIYEVHFGSWRRKLVGDEHQPLTYPEMAEQLVSYVKEMGFTHVEFLPVMEHPFYGSWGYQLTGYFAPTSRYGSPSDFMYLVDCFHREDIGVILDWVPSHFPGDAHGLYKFDGTFLYEHEDPRKGFHPDWKSYIFNYGRNEVRSFLISNALFWLDRYHIDGLRVDAVASMLYLDYSRNAGEWIPNVYGGNENIEAITFLKEMNEVVYQHFPDAVTIAEESTSWTGVSRPTYLGGLGFGQKWMMGWMHDTLHYFSQDPVYRRYHQNEITFSIVYAFTENFMLPLSHDEVVHGKGSLAGKMPGDEWQKFSNLRLLYGYMFTHPGTKLLFMGGEFGQTTEWNHERSLDWHLLEFGVHKGVQKFVADLNRFYAAEKALYQHQFEHKGFSWIDYSDQENSVIAYQRQGDSKEELIIVICNFTPIVRHHYRVGVPYRGFWKEVMSSDNAIYNGSGVLNDKPAMTSPVKYHGRDNSISLTLPPLGISIWKLDREVSEFDLPG